MHGEEMDERKGYREHRLGDGIGNSPGNVVTGRIISDSPFAGRDRSWVGHSYLTLKN
jgi:hypothetical protein